MAATTRSPRCDKSDSPFKLTSSPIGAIKVYGFNGITFLPLIAFFLFALFACSAVQPQNYLGKIPWQERTHSDSKGEVHVTVAVLSAKESEQTFGVDLENKKIQAVWLKVDNQDDKMYWFLPSGLDPAYFSPMEVSHISRKYLASKANRKMDQMFEEKSFHNPIFPGTTETGFIFTNLDKGLKVVDIDLVAENRVNKFTFWLHVPGFYADYMAVDFSNIHSEEEITDLDEMGLRTALEQLPCCTVNKKNTDFGDPLNLILIGEQDEVFPAFSRRGWHPAEQTYFASVWRTIKSFLFGSGYRYAPVSPLYYDGRPRDLAGQKARNTIHQRNHLRLWYTPLRFMGKPIWIGQISRDIGVKFTSKSPTFTTHIIDPYIDDARQALITDLLYSQQVAKVGYVSGVGAATPENPKYNLTADPVHTDGLRAVLLFDSHPHSLSDIEFFPWEIPE